MKKVCVIVSLVIILLITGCRGKVDIDINDYKPLKNYTFEKNDLIMRIDVESGSTLRGIYSLKGLSPDKYVGHVESSLMLGVPVKTLYCKKDVEEPIFCIDPYKIELSVFNVKTNDIKTFTIKDKNIVKQLVDVRRTQGTQTDTYATRPINMSFIFDLRCDLKWECTMVVAEKNIKMFWEDNESNQKYICDITDILEQHSIAEDIYSLLEQ